MPGAVFGRSNAVNAVHDAMRRTAIGVRKPRRVLVFEGSRGYGKSALLGMLAEKVDQRAPHAELDLAAGQEPQPVPNLLSALAFQLSRQCPGYDVRFPRFVIGGLVIRENIDLDNHPNARSQVFALLKMQRNLEAVLKFLQDTAGNLLNAANLGVFEPAGRAAPGLVTNVMVRLRATRRFVLAPYHDWYGHRGRRLSNDAIDVLVELNRWSRNDSEPDNRQRIDELLWDAFLADLRDAFRSKTGPPYDCAVLLDNADTPSGAEFLHGVVRIRRQHAADDAVPPDPLTVVATSRGDLLAGLPQNSVAELGTGQVDDGARLWWARFRLGDLGDDVVDSMVTALALREGNNARLARLTRDLTGGHPAATRLMLDSVAEHPQDRDHPEQLLGRPEPVFTTTGQAQRRLVGDKMLSDLIGAFPGDLLDDLVTCSAAVDHTDLRRLVQHSGLVEAGASALGTFEDVLWPVAGGAGAVLARRLLRRILSGRKGTRSWEVVFVWLRRDAGVRGLATSEAWYALACCDLRFAADLVRRRLTETDAVTWLRELDQVTNAPLRPTELDAEPPAERMRQLLKKITPAQSQFDPIDRLVAALWIAGDPFTDARRASLHRHIAGDFRSAAAMVVGDADPLLRRADHHDREAVQWL
jgi:hypothetical protein